MHDRICGAGTNLKSVGRLEASEQMTTLYRYSFAREATLAPKEYTFVVSLQGPRLQLSGKPRLFVTPHRFDKSPDAAQAVALNYLPGYRGEYQFGGSGWKFEDNIGSKVRDASNIPRHSRAWPAFGKTGGGFELALECTGPEWPRLKPLTECLLAGGADFSPFEQDIVEPLDLELATRVANGIASALIQAEVPTLERPIVGKLYSNCAVATASRGTRLFSISSAWRIIGMDVEILIWAYSWQDSFTPPTRSLFGPHLGGWHFHSVTSRMTPRKELQKTFAEKATSPTSRISVRLDDAIRQVVARVTRPSEEYVEAHSIPIRLP